MVRLAQNIIIWFRNDLRLQDNPLIDRVVEYLKHGAKAGKKETQGSKPWPLASGDTTSTRVIPIYCIDPGYESRYSDKQWTFRKQCINDLSDSMRSLGLELRVFHDTPKKVVKEITNRLPSSSGVVLCSDEACYEETEDQKGVKSVLSKGEWSLETVWTHTMYHPDDLPFRLPDGLPNGFTTMRKKIEGSNVAVRPLSKKVTSMQCNGKNADIFKEFPNILAVPFDVSRPTKPAGIFQGGEGAGLLRLANFVDNGLATYKDTRNESLGDSYSSKMSPWLATGSVSPRQIYWAIRDYEDKHGGETVHTYWVVFELMWRDYFHFFARRHGRKIFYENGVRGSLPDGVWWEDRRSKSSHQKEMAWKEGKTGLPWVDGHMRELVQTGFMSNRGRQNVASYLVHDLHVDWRVGAEFFEHHLLDNDVHSNWGNWVHAAGLAGDRVNRFNMAKQAQDYDPKGLHAKAWVPELANVPAGSIHDLADQQKRLLLSHLCPGYPSPLSRSRGGGKPGQGGETSRRKKNHSRPHHGRQGIYMTH